MFLVLPGNRPPEVFVKANASGLSEPSNGIVVIDRKEGQIPVRDSTDSTFLAFCRP